MRLSVLMDNHTLIDMYYRGEPAFCCLIEDGPRTILFDTGYSGLFMDNAEKMGLRLDSVTDIVLSHGHDDHTGGLFPYLSRFSQPVRLYAHPLALSPKRLDGMDIGAPQTQLPPQVTPVFSAGPAAVSEHVLFLGEIPRVHPHEESRDIGERFVCGRWERDALTDDTSVALLGEKGPMLLSGCAHSGICNTLEHAAQIIGERPRAVFGGMHLFDADEKLERTLAHFSECGVKTLYPAHCTSLAVKAAMFGRFSVVEVGVGMTLDIG